MKINYLGHSCFQLTESTGTTIVTDPYSEQIGYALPKVTADCVTVSHHHYDHDNATGVLGNPTVIDKEGSYDLPGVEITSIRSFHDGRRGKQRGENIIFKYRMDGIEICHLGDLGENCSLELIENIVPVNVLLIPVGGTYTINAEMAKEYIERIMPDYVIPMHFKTKDSDVDIDKIDEFLDLFEEEEIEEVGSEIEFTRDDFHGDETKILVMRRTKDE